jgi:hypothetical protein
MRTQANTRPARLTVSELTDAIYDAYGFHADTADVVLGRCNFLGGVEVFLGSQYAGYIHPRDGFVGDSTNWPRSTSVSRSV